MKLAVFFPSSLFCSWSMSYGLVDALRNLGHEVISCPVDATTGNCENALLVTIESKSIDGAIISGPEHIGAKIGRIPLPTVAWLHETVEREDYGKLDVEAIKRSADIIFCPAIQDEKYGFTWLPLGVNTDIFKPNPAQEKTIDAGFIGLVYPKRKKFLDELKPHLNGLKLHIGNVKVSNADGSWNPRLTAERYAHVIRSMKVFVNLPSLSQTAVSKVYEVLACGVPLLTPAIKQTENFEDMPCFRYEGLDELINFMHDILDHPDRIYPIKDVARLLNDHHRMELRCEKLVNALQSIGAKAA